MPNSPGGPLPFRFELNRLMIAGVVVGGAGLVGWGAEMFDAYPPDSRWGDAFRGLTLLGMALYFLGRIVQLYAQFRNRR